MARVSAKTQMQPAGIAGACSSTGKILSVFTGAMLALTATANAAVNLPTRHVLTLELAHKIVAAAEEEAQRKGAPCVIAIADASGYLISLDRMDGSPLLASVELAPGKARTAALFAKPSKALEDAVHGGRTALVTAGFVEMAGGLPLTIDGEQIGAIGVSSAQPDLDVQIAAAGVAALSALPIDSH